MVTFCQSDHNRSMSRYERACIFARMAVERNAEKEEEKPGRECVDETETQKENPMNDVLFQNASGSILDLGSTGEYPYSSKVGRKFIYQDECYTWWYRTEMNPRGATEVERDTRAWKDFLESGQTTNAWVKEVLTEMGYMVPA